MNKPLTYVIADLHGRFDLLVRALGYITARSSVSGFQIVLLGDYIDRGPHSREIVEHLMAAQSSGLPIICLQGNHEDMLLETITKPLDPGWWIGNGGAQTLKSYGHAVRGQFDPSVVPAEHLAWMRALPKSYITQHRVYVHAGVNPDAPLDEQTDAVLQWWRYPDGADVGHGDRHVVHGHDAFAGGPILLRNRTNLDTLAWVTGKLVVGVFDEALPGGPIDLIGINGSPR